MLISQDVPLKMKCGSISHHLCLGSGAGTAHFSTGPGDARDTGVSASYSDMLLLLVLAK